MVILIQLAMAHLDRDALALPISDLAWFHVQVGGCLRCLGCAYADNRPISSGYMEHAS